MSAKYSMTDLVKEVDGLIGENAREMRDQFNYLGVRDIVDEASGLLSSYAQDKPRDLRLSVGRAGIILLCLMLHDSVESPVDVYSRMDRSEFINYGYDEVNGFFPVYVNFISNIGQIYERASSGMPLNGRQLFKSIQALNDIVNVLNWEFSGVESLLKSMSDALEDVMNNPLLY